MNNQNFLVGQWVGTTCGTHVSNILAVFNIQDDLVSISLKSADVNTQKITIFSGTCSQRECVVILTIYEMMNDQPTGIDGNVTLKICSATLMEGEFTLNSGAQGIIKLSKYIKEATKNSNQEPPQIIAKEHVLPFSMKIYKPDILAIIESMQSIATVGGCVIINEQNSDRTTVRKYAGDYLKLEKHQSNITSLTITAQVNIEGFINTLTLNLNKIGTSNIISQSNNMQWSQSAPLLLKELLEKQKNILFMWYRKYGLEINGILLLTVLVILPNFNLKMRAVIMVGLLAFVLMHRFFYRTVSQTTIEANLEKPTKISERFPKIMYFLGFISTVLLTAAITYSTNKGLDHIFPTKKDDNQKTVVQITQELHRDKDDKIQNRL